MVPPGAVTGEPRRELRRRPRRWDQPFDPEMSAAGVERLLSLTPFSRMDREKFSHSMPLDGILRNDTRILRLEHGDIVIREGDYGNSAFLILSGTVRVDISSEPALPAPVLGRLEPKRMSLVETVAQLWSNEPYPEARRSTGTTPGPGTDYHFDADGNVRLFLQDVPAVLEKARTVRLTAGELFGEVAALGRIPRTATVFSDGGTELLEIRWQGLRDIMRQDPEMRSHIDHIYRERNLQTHILASPIFQHLDHRSAPDDCGCDKCTALRDVVESTKFETWGDFDWHVSLKRLASEGAAGRFQKEPIIAEEGHYPNGVILVRSGFARVSQRVGEGHRTISYLGRGHAYGLAEIVHNWCHDEEIALQHSLRAVGYTAVLIVPTWIIERHVLGADRDNPIVGGDLLPPPIPVRETTPAPPTPSTGDGVDQIVLEFFVAGRYMNGTAAMVINLDRCTQCDDCVRACASTHDNNPRFIRHGPTIGNVMVANACMHCADPVCMIGCPTGAIHRNPLGGEVVINDATCIGCGTCANSCPYDNIRMVDIRNPSGELVLDIGTGLSIQKATKCDLCATQLAGPACQRACPHDALVRVDLTGDLGAIQDWVKL